MRTLIILIGFSLIHCCAFAKTLPSSGFFDTESSVNIPLHVWTNGLKSGDLTLSFNATPTNNVELLFGCDFNQDQIISIEESSFAICWDCGKWELVDSCKNIYYDASSNENESKSLLCKFKISQVGIVEYIKFYDGEKELFSELDEIIKLSFFAKLDTLQITSRGVRNVADKIIYEAHLFGLNIRIR